jgi:hypothetical protein
VHGQVILARLLAAVENGVDLLEAVVHHAGLENLESINKLCYLNGYYTNSYNSIEPLTPKMNNKLETMLFLSIVLG